MASRQMLEKDRRSHHFDIAGLAGARGRRLHEPLGLDRLVPSTMSNTGQSILTTDQDLSSMVSVSQGHPPSG